MSTSISILPDRHYFHLGNIGSKFAPEGRYWAPSLYHCGRHHGKQKHLKVANPQLQPPSSLNHCSFTQYQHARCSFYITSIDLTCWFGRFLRFRSSRAAEAMKVKSGADIRHGTLGIVFSMNCQEMPPPPTQMRLVYIWVKRRRLSATEVVHGPHKSIRTNFRMGGVMGVVMALGHISRYRHAPTHRYRPKIPSSNIQEGI